MDLSVLKSSDSEPEMFQVNLIRRFSVKQEVLILTCSVHPTGPFIRSSESSASDSEPIKAPVDFNSTFQDQQTCLNNNFNIFFHNNNKQ